MAYTKAKFKSNCNKTSYLKKFLILNMKQLFAPQTLL